MICYFDASALTKRYVREPESKSVIQLVRENTIATCRLSAIEIVSALARRCREGALTSEERDRVLTSFRQDFSGLYVIELSADISAMSQDLLIRFTLRAGDAIQLASGLYLQQRLHSPVHFVAYDTRLNNAAQQAGLSLLS